MPKETLRQLILAQLEQERHTHQAAADLARDEAISEESRAESKYDTHSQEAAYLAEAQARLCAELAEAISLYRVLPLPGFAADGPVGLGALVEIESHGTGHWYLLGPTHGGLQLQLDGHPVTLLTPQSPLGVRLLGRRTGDLVPLPRGPGRILHVR